MNKYKQFELAIFNWLKSKNEADTNFTFSLRQKANKGAELNYFIGTENSKYFSTTFWNIPVAYPGSSSDLINLVFGFDKNNNYVYDIQFNQTKNPESEQNELALQLIRNCKTIMKSTFDRFYENDASNKMEFFRINGKSSYTSIDELIVNANADIEKVIPIVTTEIDKLKKDHPSFRGHRFTIQEQKKMFEKMEIRFENYKNSGTKIVLVDDTEDELVSENHIKNHIPLNQILYGPPGTGKTFKLQQIIEEWDLKEKTNAKKDYASFAKSYTWWKIIALALLDLERVTVPELAKHPLIMAKLGSSNIKSLKTRLWSSLQHHCVDDCENVKLLKRIGEKVFYKEANSEWRLDSPVAFKLEFIPLVDAYEEFKASDDIKSKDYTFSTCHQSLTYEDFIEGIKPDLNKINEDEDEEQGKQVVYEIRKGVFYNACEKAAQKAGFVNLKDCLDKTKKERIELFDKAIAENKIHVIFLDEINRCNVSSVFGELITLIEDDKRLGKENEIADVTLPYSQETFGVPANLYIFGTMNTADRSVEALDTALRRRFSFEEMPPLYDLKELDYSISEYKATDILKTINTRIEKLINKDHAIGHSYFLNKNNESMVESFYKNIIPLLQEYFFGDYGKIGLVLGKGFVRLKEYEKETTVFADFDTDTANDFDDRNVYEIIDYRKVKDYKLTVNKTVLDMNFETAIQVLMNKKFE